MPINYTGLFSTGLPSEVDWWGNGSMVGTDDGSPVSATVANNQATVDNYLWDNTQRNWAISDRENAQALDSAANQFLNSWLGNLSTASDMYQGAYSSAADIYDMANSLEDEWAAYGEKFGGLQDELINQASSDLAVRNQFGEEFQRAASADYAGAARTALADVAQQSKIGRDALGRSLAGMGINANSGKAMAGLRQSYLDEAKNKALAMNTANNAEKSRVANLSATGMKLYDPSTTAGLAIGIQQGQNDLATAASGLAQSASTAQTNAANGYAQNVAAPMGELSGTISGLVAQSGANPFTSKTTYEYLNR